MDKPIGVIIEEVKQNIADTLNNSNLHPYIMDCVIKDIYEEVHSIYMRTVQAEKAEYEKSQESTEE